MAIRIRYVSKGMRDMFLAQNSQGIPVWKNDPAEATEFTSEASAKSFLAEGGFELNPQQTIYETSAGRA